MNEKKVELSYQKFEFFSNRDGVLLTQYFKTRSGERFKVFSELHYSAKKVIFNISIFSINRGWLEYLRTDRDFEGANLNINSIYERVSKCYIKRSKNKEYEDDLKKEILASYLKNSHIPILNLIKNL